ncbi:MAG: PD40 domain-containing protein [Saprospiraceae bacterium]|nr:PD40 domain-containing protein [Saprospiraceae bacterium]
MSSENGGRVNVSPSISPNGKYIIFLSEKTFSLPTFTLRMLKKVTSSEKCILQQVLAILII